MNRLLVKLSDLQFPKYFIENEIDLGYNIIDGILNTDVEIEFSGEPDRVINRGTKIVVSNPSSVNKFLFNVLYSTLSPYVANDFQKDKLALGLVSLCYEYCHYDYEPIRGRSIPVIIDGSKIPIVSSLITDIIEPIIGQVPICDVLFAPCKFTDVCRIIKSQDQVIKQYGFHQENLPNSSFPLILCNTSVQNEAAQSAHLLCLVLENAIGKEKTVKVIKRILLDRSERIVESLIIVLKMLNGIPDFVVDFLKYLENYASLGYHELEESGLNNVLLADQFFTNVKIANEGTNSVTKQWSQWSSLLGLIEKQLSSTRGSMWPTSVKMKPHEDQLRKIIVDKQNSKQKNQLNFEELLESYRDLYEHKAIEPGKLIERVLKDNRVW